jgi:hypothetical protein
MLYDPRWQEAEPLFDLSKPSLRALSYVLRHRELWPKDFNWQYYDCDSCAMGLASALWKSVGPACTGSMSRNFEIGISDAAHIFIDAISWSGYGTVSPEMVADQIDKYLSK